ncbi:transcriptional repressor [Corynebacterium sp. NML140438]|uniref:Fur family transcriptional regulator n=1 Tax=Corynebacterium sp. NML140438 TaxID=1906334 RepID=UPI0008FB61AD|nr:Fur family transcriptional regulator [Corynebacterium sp. NML140438]OIR46004.1 transcriptional repressor [Corynebacterium sp. NML140438]
MPSSKNPVRKLGPRMTRQRQAVVDTLQAIDKFSPAKDIHAALLARDEQVGLTTVYRTLQGLAEIGAVDVIQSPDGETLYRHCLTEHHHHHLVCVKCGTSEEIEGGPVESWAEATAKEHGFTLVAHEAEIYGVCRDCQA